MDPTLAQLATELALPLLAGDGWSFEDQIRENDPWPDTMDGLSLGGESCRRSLLFLEEDEAGSRRFDSGETYAVNASDVARSSRILHPLVGVVGLDDS